jgi:hypothetical protein
MKEIVNLFMKLYIFLENIYDKADKADKVIVLSENKESFTRHVLLSFF